MPARSHHHDPIARPLLSLSLRLLAGSSIVAGAGAMLLTSAKIPQRDTAARIITVAWAGDTEPEDEGIRECVITLRSGRTITGELVSENDREVVIGINGIETTFQRKNVANIVILPPIAERYAQLRATIADDDVDSRLALVEWLRARRAYSIALKELSSILIIDPHNPHAKLLHTWLSEHEKLAESSGEDEDDPTTPTQTNTESSPTDPERAYSIERNVLPHLSVEQLNLLRVYEIDLRDPPKLRVPDETILKLMRENPDKFSPDESQRNAVLDLPEVDKLRLLFTHRARDLYQEVQVLENPRSLELFKDQVHTGRGWLINACASTRCHGGVDAGSFRLINTKPNTDETAFTNLYIIEQTKLADGRPLIDFEYPDRSPLLQMGMIQGKALIPHPEIPQGYPGLGFRPIFRDTKDRKYQQAVEWIRSMYQPRPELGFDYPLNPAPTPPKPDQSDP